MRDKIFPPILIVFLLALTACAQKAPASAAQSPFKLTASIQDIMVAQIDPAADFIWASVGSVTTAAGTQDAEPRTDQEWLAVRRNAITLIEATNLLVMQGRQVALPGNRLEDAHVEGILTAPEIQQAIDTDRAAFIKLAHDLHAAGLAALAAIDAKDTGALSAAGGTIDEACERCHLTYWYPNSPRPAELGGIP